MNNKIIGLIITLIIVAVFVFYNHMCKKYRNPYKLYIAVGKKGSGKSTLITKQAYKLTKRHQHVFINCPVNLSPDQMKYIHYIGALDLWKVDYKLISPDCKIIHVLVDEAGLDYDCRKWDTFPSELKEWFKFQRKHRARVYLYSQALDVDKKLKDLADRLMLLSCENGWLSFARYVDRKIVFTKASDFSGSTIADELKPAFPLFPWSWIITYIPRWKKYFDTESTSFMASETIRSKSKK